MGKICKICGKKIRSDGQYCWVHKNELDKREQTKQGIKEILKEQEELHKTGYMLQLSKFNQDTSRNFEKEKNKFEKREKRYKELHEIGEELYDEEYQVIPNRLKEFKKMKD